MHACVHAWQWTGVAANKQWTTTFITTDNTKQQQQQQQQQQHQTTTATTTPNNNNNNSSNNNNNNNNSNNNNNNATTATPTQHRPSQRLLLATIDGLHGIPAACAANAKHRFMLPQIHVWKLDGRHAVTADEQLVYVPRHDVNDDAWAVVPRTLTRVAVGRWWVCALSEHSA
jgi:hypothetical protein